MSEAAWDDLIERAIADEIIRPAFQPIVDIQRGVVAGYEALARFVDGPDVGPDEWFARAFERGRLDQLDRSALRAALARRDRLPLNTYLSVNVEPISLVAPIVMRELHAHAPLDGLVIELTEHGAVPDWPAVVEATDRLRSMGALIAVDDAGAGYSGLQQILDLRPQFLKLDRSLVTGVDGDEAKAALVEMLGVFANRIDAWVVAEGVETEGEAERCRHLGVPLAQGWFYAKPAMSFCTDGDLPDAVRREAATDRDAGLRPLLRSIPVISAAALDQAASYFSRLRIRHAVVLDGTRALGLMTPSAAFEGEVLSTFRANVNTSPDELAHRIAVAADGDRFLPVIVSDDAGRYVGVVPVNRLLGHLADR